ncbi:MAG TPA: universal stress protein [Gammaproteobacteria bacterium]|nr:universal stress protein [Gammaproteobacteria bacterium]
MFNKVLVLADGDDPRQPALRRARQCVADGGEIEILSVVYEPALEGYLGNREIYEPLRRRVLDERRERAAVLARSVKSEGVRASSKAVWSHPMHAAIAAEVAASGIDLVVAAPASLHQGGGAGGAGLTHGDWEVVTSSRAPLLMVKSDGSKPYRSIVAAVDPFHAHAKPAALDRSILRAAKEFQQRTRAMLVALHCHFPIEYFGADLARIAPKDPRLVDSRLEAVRALCAEEHIPAEAARLVTGAPHTVLTDMQQRGEADLVVMGALARGRFTELILGNTAERVLHYGSGDVLVVTPSRLEA